MVIILTSNGLFMQGKRIAAFFLKLAIFFSVLFPGGVSISWIHHEGLFSMPKVLVLPL